MRPSAEPTRRSLLGGSAAAILAQWAALAQPASSGVVYAYVGCYTTAQRYARGDGIHVYRVDPGTGAWSHVQHVGDLVNPSFLVVHPDRRSLYSVHGDESYAMSFSLDRETGRLTERNRVETGGRNGVHQAIDPSGRFLLVANYSTGSVSVLPISPDGALAGPVQVVTLQGQPGPHRIEQTSSHPHHIVFDPSGRYVIVPDKGLDRIFIFRFDPDGGKLTATEQGAAVARAGSGPRHAAFHPTLPVTWVVNEIGSTIAT
ncbi:fragment of putative 6-phosphogluconolactonase, YbhE-type (part 1/2) [Candidatus Sulfopaludibacter sp. SbA6]|nr:fragment of putative 6-phosphogluconolactonase, YbhE-type (part 1/2) [Candidatus Sulfopaludibacter sp. SbA6]